MALRHAVLDDVPESKNTTCQSEPGRAVSPLDTTIDRTPAQAGSDFSFVNMSCSRALREIRFVMAFLCQKGIARLGGANFLSSMPRLCACAGVRRHWAVFLEIPDRFQGSGMGIEARAKNSPPIENRETNGRNQQVAVRESPTR
jgi:hypothetical protein